MKRFVLGAGSICISLGLSACGGSSRGLSADIPVFNTVTVVISSANPNPLESDVLAHVPTTELVRSQPSVGCNTLVRVDDVCTGANYTADNVAFTFRSESIKNAQGQPATPNPSSVLVEKYRVSFSGCISGVYEFPVGQVIAPNEEKAFTIQPITQDMKMGISQRVQYVYINQDGCQTVFNVPTYQGICNAVANFEFSLLELNSGIRRTIKYSLAIRIADYASEADQCLIR